jgi:hypothetical protein
LTLLHLTLCWSLHTFLLLRHRLRARLHRRKPVHLRGEVLWILELRLSMRIQLHLLL